MNYTIRGSLKLESEQAVAPLRGHVGTAVWRHCLRQKKGIPTSGKVLFINVIAGYPASLGREGRREGWRKGGREGGSKLGSNRSKLG